MDTFNFPYHEFEDTYPETGGGMKFGNSYDFRFAPSAPPTKIFTLNMTGMRYIFSGESIDDTSVPQLNIRVLDAFFLKHQLHEKFIYPHPVRGDIVVRFMSPLEIPKVIRGSRGILPDFTIKLIEQP